MRISFTERQAIESGQCRHLPVGLSELIPFRVPSRRVCRRIDSPQSVEFPASTGYLLVSRSVASVRLPGCGLHRGVSPASQVGRAQRHPTFSGWGAICRATPVAHPTCSPRTPQLNKSYATRNRCKSRPSLRLVGRWRIHPILRMLVASRACVSALPCATHSAQRSRASGSAPHACR